MTDDTIQEQQLTLYSIADAPDACDETSWWCAVWAISNVDALLYASRQHDKPIDLFVIQSATAIDLQYQPQSFATARPSLPCEETRGEVLRLIGWRQADEDYCVSCTCAAMGCAEFTVCPDCDNCRVCAADEDEPFQCHCVTEGETP